MRRSPNQPPWREEDEPSTISDCYMVTFDIGENMDSPTAVVLKQSSTGPHIVRIFHDDDAIAVYETLTGEEISMQ